MRAILHGESRVKKLTLPLLMLSTLITSSAVQAFDSTSYLAKGAEVSLSFSRHDQTMRANVSGNETEVSIQRSKLTAYEAPYNSWLQGGMHFGYVKISHDDQAFTSGRTPVGEFFGLQLRSRRDDSKPLNLHWLLAYTYNHADAATETDNTRSKITLHEYQAELGIIGSAWDMRFSAGGYLNHVEGEEQRTQTILDITTTRNLKFENIDDSGAFISIAYRTENNGYIELIARSGSLQGGALLLTKHF